MISTKGMDYGMISYFIYDRDIHPVEQSIVNAIRKISLYKNHLQSTTKLYGSEYSQQLDQLVITEKIQITEANERITQILAGAEQTEENRLYAEHMSGYDTIIFGYVDAKEELYNNFNEMVGYFNKSALVSSYSLLESELRRLCIILQETTNEKLSLKDISGSDYFGSMIKYLSLVIDIDTNKLEHYISKIRDLQKLRNKIVHSNGELISNTEDKESRVNLLRIINQNKGTLSLKIDSETQIETIQIDNSNYIAKYYSIFNAFFSRTLWCIDKRLDHSFLISRFTYLLNSIINVLKLTIKEVDITGNYIIIKTIVDYLYNDSAYNIYMNVGIKIGTKEEFVTFNQLENPSPFDRLFKHLNSRPRVFLNIFNGFLPDNKKFKISVTIFDKE